ncbi:MAG: hypothetical protein KIS92_14620, partial [Planctomycetota bacterium]|nr:hypothetical protein [Planctomycetota bacterium]
MVIEVTRSNFEPVYLQPLGPFMVSGSRISPRLIVFITLVIGVIFVVDIHLPLGVAGGVPYVAAVLLSLGAPDARFTLWVGILCSVLTVLGHFMSTTGAEHYFLDVINRILALFAIWVTAILSLKRKRAEEERARMEKFAFGRERLALLGELAAGIAHEFRNPLDGVLNCIQLLRSRVNGQAGNVELLDMADEALHRMGGISARMLRLGREEMGAHAPTPVSEVIDAAVYLVRMRAEKEGVRIETFVEPGLPQIAMDAERISEAILNLLTNAIDACARGGKVSVRACRNEQPSDSVAITVSDNGSGVPAAIRKRIFEPFYTTKPVGKGSGLG